MTPEPNIIDVAIKIMAGLVSSGNIKIENSKESYEELCARKAFDYAEAFMKEYKKKKEEWGWPV